jgi:cell division protein FtsQ
VFPTNNDYVRHLLIANGNIDFPNDVYENVNGETLSDTDLPEIFSLMKEVMADDYSRCCVKQIYKDKKKNYIFSLNNTNIIVIFGDVNNVKDKLTKMKHFFTKMQGNPELDNYKEINLNFKNQVVCTKNK